MTAPRKPHLIIYIFALSFMITIDYAFGRYLFQQITPQIVAALQLDYEFIGKINLLNQGVYLIFAAAGGFLSARYGAKRLVTIVALVCALSVLSLAFVSNKWLLMFIVGFQGIFTSLGWIPMVELVARTIPAESRGLAMGMISSGTSYGVILSGYLTPKILAQYDWNAVWLFFGLFSLLLGGASAFAAYAFAPPELKQEEEQSASKTGDSLLAPTATNPKKDLWLMSAVMVLTGIALVPVQAYLAPLVESDLGGTTEISGRCWMILGVLGLPSGFVGGYIADRLSAKKAMLIGYGLAALAIIILIAIGSQTVMAIYVACALLGLVFNAIFGFHPTYLARVLPPEQTAKYFGFLNLALSIGGMLGNYGGGYIKEFAGTFNPAYWLMAGLALVVATMVSRLTDDRGR